MRIRGFSQKGIALVAVTACIAIIAIIAAEFSYNTSIDFEAAANARDEMRAHFLAQSGINLSRLVVKVQKDIFDKYRKYLGDVQLADYLPLMIGAFGGGEEEVTAMAEALGADPTVGDIKGLGLPKGSGEFDVQVTTDDGKINVNCANGSQQTQKQLELTLTALVLPNAYDKLFEDRDGDGQFTDRQMFVHAIMDYVDRDTAAFGQNGSAEDYGYESMGDSYRSRDNYLDSVDELQLVRGMDDQKWALFGPAFTIYGGCKVNLSAVTDLNVIAALIYQSAKDPNDPVLADPQKLWALAARVAQARTLGIMFDETSSFMDFVKDPDGALLGAAGEDPQAAAGTQAAAATTATQTSLPPIQNTKLDQQKLNQIARTGGRRTYRVTASAKVGRVEKKIEAIWDTDTVNQNMRDPAYAKGTWVYWREE